MGPKRPSSRTRSPLAADIAVLKHMIYMDTRPNMETFKAVLDRVKPLEGSLSTPDHHIYLAALGRWAQEKADEDWELSQQTG
jgi:hypothetical protein